MKIKYCYLIFLIIITTLLLQYFGVFLHYYELDYYEKFEYPIKGDIRPLMDQLKSGQDPAISPFNTHDYYLLKNANSKCSEVRDNYSEREEFRLIYIVKSSISNFERRSVIRKTWGVETRFADVPIRTVFILGSSNDKRVESKVKSESEEFGDIVQGDFIDSYYNNTFKALTGLKWAHSLCANSQFYFFVDDDYYVSTRNVLRFLRNPVHYPRYLYEDVLQFNDDSPSFYKNRQLKQLIDYELPKDVKFYSGYVFHSPPHRHKPSKWYVSLEEYPYHLWPPYVTAGAYVLSKAALNDFFWASHFVKKFRFDDVYMGLLAKKTNIEPFHTDEFYFYKKDCRLNKPNDYEYVVASHGYSDPKELLKFWSIQKQAGNA